MHFMFMLGSVLVLLLMLGKLSQEKNVAFIVKADLLELLNNGFTLPHFLHSCVLSCIFIKCNMNLKDLKTDLLLYVKHCL